MRQKRQRAKIYLYSSWPVHQPFPKFHMHGGYRRWCWHRKRWHWRYDRRQWRWSHCCCQCHCGQRRCCHLIPAENSQTQQERVLEKEEKASLCFCSRKETPSWTFNFRATHLSTRLPHARSYLVSPRPAAWGWLLKSEMCSATAQAIVLQGQGQVFRSNLKGLCSTKENMGPNIRKGHPSIFQNLHRLVKVFTRLPKCFPYCLPIQAHWSSPPVEAGSSGSYSEQPGQPTHTYL